MLDSYRILNENKFLYSIRNGMVMAIPAVMVGVFAILLSSRPVTGYQEFIHSFGKGFLVTVFSIAQRCTVDIFVLILLVTVSQTYGRLLDARYPGILTILCICAYTAFAVSRLYVWMTSRNFFRVMAFTEGSDSHCNAAMSSMLPFAVIILLTILFKLLLVRLSGSPDLQVFLTRSMGRLFAGGKRNIWSLLEFVFLMHIFL